jgi:hypothetical protein
MYILAAGKGFLLQRTEVASTVPVGPQREKPLRGPAGPAKGSQMTIPLTVDLPHKLGAQEARRRIELNVGKLTDHIPGGAQVGSRWTGDRLDLEVGAMGQQISVQIEIQETLVRMTVNLPPALSFFRGMIEPLIRQQGAVLLEDRSGGAKG